MRDRKRNSLWYSLGIAGLLIVTSACDNKPTTIPSTLNNKNSSGSMAGTPNTQSFTENQNDKQVVTTCSDLSQEDCEKTLFGLQRCKKDGDKCVEIPKFQSCKDFSDNADCIRSCKLNGTNCEDKTAAAPCDSSPENSPAKCAHDERTGKWYNIGGYCRHKVELCAATAPCSDTYSGLCGDVEVSQGEKCRWQGGVGGQSVCHGVLGRSTVGPTVAIKLSTTDANGTGATHRTGICVHGGADTANFPARLNPTRESACQELFLEELADRDAKNTAVPSSFSTDPVNVCSALTVSGVTHSDGATANDHRVGGDDFWNVYGAKVDVDDIIKAVNYKLLNIPGWCGIQAVKETKCYPNASFSSNRCNRHTNKSDCEGEKDAGVSVCVSVEQT